MLNDIRDRHFNHFRIAAALIALGAPSVSCAPLEDELAPTEIEAAEASLLAKPGSRIFLGSSHHCAIVERGAVKCWGANFSGQLGYGDTNARGDVANEMGDNLPFVNLGTNRYATDMVLGDSWTCALLDNATLKCWGHNFSGQLGQGDTVYRGDNANEMGDNLLPIPLGTGRTVKSIGGGTTHMCAVLDNDTLKCWGMNSEGELGLGDTAYRGDGPGEMGDALPIVNVGTGRTVRAVGGGRVHTCALLDNGTVKCWGGNPHGMCGTGDTVQRGDAAGEMGNALPTVNLGTGRTAKSISVGYQNTCALLDNDTLKCWGAGDFGQLGQGNTNNLGDNAGEMGDALPAINLGTGRIPRQVVMTAGHGCAVLDNATLKCWGFNASGDLGLGHVSYKGDNAGEMGNSLPALNLGTGLLVASVGTGGQADSTCATLTNGKTKCWGPNNSGQLGLGDENPRGATAASMGNGLPYLNLGTKRGVQTVVTGTYHACALTANGAVECWGGSPQGQLGNGNTLSMGDALNEMGNTLPTVNLGTGRTAKQLSLSANGDFTCALLDNATVKCWGHSTAGSLGTGDNNHRGDNAGEMGDSLPAVNLGTGRTAKAVVAGGVFTCAILDNDTVKCWGSNNDGSLGQGDKVNRGLAPSELGDALPAINLGTGRKVKQLAAGAWHACAILDNNAVKCWGANSFGQLGLGDNQRRGDGPGEMGDALPAVNFGTGRTPKSIAAGATFTCVHMDNNQVKCWGDNLSGSLGYGDTVRRGDNAGEMADALPTVNVGTGRTVKALRAGGGVVCVLRDDQALVCWGTNGAGNLGIDASDNRGDAATEMGNALVPVKLGNPTNMPVAVPTDWTMPTFFAGTTSCASIANGSFKCWGQNLFGQLGLGNTQNKGDSAGEMATIGFIDLGTEP
jgi:alpha-tubulin suppressor-like RCC1 family protein